MDRETPNHNDNNPDDPKDTPPAAPASTPEPQGDVAESQNYAQAVVNICTLAGMKDQALDFIAKGTSLEDVAKTLLTAKAAISEATAITSAITNPSPETQAPAVIDTAATYANRNKKPTA